MLPGVSRPTPHSLDCVLFLSASRERTGCARRGIGAEASLENAAATRSCGYHVTEQAPRLCTRSIAPLHRRCTDTTVQYSPVL